MGKNPFEEMDPDLKAMRASSASPLRWSRVLTGILLVGCVTFGVAFYLPLRQAHETLSMRFTELQTQVASANHSAQQAQAQAKELGEKKQALQDGLDQTEQLAKAQADASRAVTSALTAKLSKPLAKDQAALAVAVEQTVASLSLGYLLSPGKLATTPDSTAALCGIVASSSKETIRVLAIADKKSIPPALAPKLKTALDYSGAVAALVVETLRDKCSADPSRLSATSFPAEPSPPPKLDGKRLTGPRVELWLDPAQ